MELLKSRRFFCGSAYTHLLERSVASLPQKLQSKSTLSCEIVQIHSQSVSSWFYKETESQSLTEIENRRIFCDGFRKTDLGTDLISNAFRGSIQNTNLFSIFSSFIFMLRHLSFRKTEGDLFLLTVKG